MQTTIDLPDDLLQRATARAARDGLTLAELITRLVASAVAQDSPPPAVPAPPMRGSRSEPPVIAKAAIGRPIPALSHEELVQEEMEDDLAAYERSLGR